MKTLEEILTGKNIHSVYTLCNECHTWGVNLPLNKECGNCGSMDTLKYYDIETIEEAIKEERAILYTYTVKIENEHWSTYRFILNAKDDEEAIAIATKEYDLSPAITAIEIEGKYRVMSGLIRAEGFED